MDTQTEELEQQILENAEPIVYIAGKVTGLPYAEVYAKFRAAQLKLEAQKFNVLNPLEHIDKDARWDKAMRKAIILLCQSDFIYLLPDWPDSEGAKIERSLALRLNIPTIEG